MHFKFLTRRINHLINKPQIERRGFRLDLGGEGVMVVLFCKKLLRSSFYDLRGNNILSLCKPRTTSFGLSSFSYFSAKQWNALPDCIRTSDFTEFKRNIQGMTFV